MTQPVLELSGIRKSYGTHVAVENVDLSLDPEEFVTFLGPSGSGKTTTLMMVAGLQQPDGGSIKLGGAPIERQPPYRRDIGMVFQHYALFPHMSVRKNVAFPSRRSSARSPMRWNWWAWANTAIACRASCPAASSSAWRWPARWSIGRPCC